MWKPFSPPSHIAHEYNVSSPFPITESGSTLPLPCRCGRRDCKIYVHKTSETTRRRQTKYVRKQRYLVDFFSSIYSPMPPDRMNRVGGSHNIHRMKGCTDNIHYGVCPHWGRLGRLTGYGRKTQRKEEQKKWLKAQNRLSTCHPRDGVQS